MATRAAVRKKFDEALERPLDKQAAEQYDRERWGLSDEAIAEAARLDDAWADATYE